MATLILEDICKVYPGYVQAVQDFSLRVEEGEFIVIVGPSGCGKSTLLRMIAGLEEISSGKLYIHDRMVNDVRPRDRDIAMVFQSPALYPHLTVYDNIGIGMWKSCSLEEMDQRIRHTADILEISEYLSQKPDTLSGGQKQRVAIGRAMVRNAGIILFDEPFSSLDTRLRMQMRAEITALHKKLKSTVIYVTHDHVEAMTMASRIVVMKEGRILQIGTPDEIYNAPANMFTANFMGAVGMNFLEGMYQDHKLCVYGREVNISSSMQKKMEPYQGKKVFLGIRPEDLHIESQSISDDDSTFLYHVNSIEYLGHDYVLHGSIEEDSTRIIAYATFPVKEGDVCRLVMNMENVHFFDVETKQKII